MLAGRWDKRRKKRKPKHQPAWIRCGAQRRAIPCILCDISSEGARLAPARFGVLPDVFTLILSKDGSSRRLCRVVWRRKLHVGVQFIAPGEIAPRQHQSAAQAPPAKQAGAPEALPAHLYRLRAAACTDRKEFTFSSVAATLMWLLIAATTIFYVGSLEVGQQTPWALALCQEAKNFCQHPEWSGIPAALMALVYFSVRGMEI